jgi:polysaccharide export outer membrane protein
MIRYRNILLTLSLAVGACSAIPNDGPRATDIERPNPSYALIDLNPRMASIVTNFVAAQRTEPPIHLPAGQPLGLIGPGDLLKIAIWEPNPNGTSLTSDKTGIETTGRVGIDGTIGVPYVGRLHAAGRTPGQLERDVTGRLAHEAPGAQDVVLVLEDVTNDVMVQGDVVKPGRYPVVPHSSGLLDILAMAGGPHTPDRQTQIRITRGDTSVTRTLTHLVKSRAMETDLAPGDRILVEPRLAYFYAFGAVNRAGEQPYDVDDISLAHTLARIQGLTDQRADAASVFIYRHQKADLTRQLAPDKTATDVIYRLNLRDPAGFFVSEKFPVLPDDLIYVSTAPIADAAKVIQLLVGVSNLGAVPHNLGAPY